MTVTAVTSPPAFRHLRAQEKAKELLRAAFDHSRLAHAYLFRGPAGVGKKRGALAFAAYINCLTPRERDACGVCPSCIKFRAGSHPDFLTIAPEGAAIKIGQIRALKRALDFPPLEARWRVVLLTEVHTMRREAANSLLKTLEEPPERTILVLTGTEASAILPTILSRCQVIPFFPLPWSEVAAALKEEGAAAATAATLAGVAEGSLGRARLLQQTELLSLRRKIVQELLALSPDEPAAVETVFRLAEEAAALKENLPELLGLLQIWLRDLLLMQAGLPDSLLISRDLDDLLAAAAHRWPRSALIERLRLLDRSRRYLNQNCNRSLVCEVLFFSLL